MTQERCSSTVCPCSKSLTPDGYVWLCVKKKSSAETGVWLSAYTTSRHRPASQDFQVQVVPPGVCPAVRCAVIEIGPRVSVSPPPIVCTLLTGGYVFSTPYCGSFGPDVPRSSTGPLCAVARTV